MPGEAMAASARHDVLVEATGLPRENELTTPYSAQDGQCTGEEDSTLAGHQGAQAEQEGMQAAARPSPVQAHASEAAECLLSPFARLTCQPSCNSLTTYASLTSDWLQHAGSPRAGHSEAADEWDMRSLSCSERSLLLQVQEELAQEELGEEEGSLSLGPSSKASSLEAGGPKLVLTPWKSGPCESLHFGGSESPKLSKEASDAVQKLRRMVPAESIRAMKGSYGLVDILKWELESSQSLGPTPLSSLGGAPPPL